MMNVYMRQNAVFKHGILQDIKIVSCLLTIVRTGI